MDSILGLVRHPGNEALFQAIEMSLLATLAGQPLHIHAEGLRGTGKTSIMRAVRRVLPRIRRIKGCLYNCDPAEPYCPAHRGLSADGVSALGDEWVPMPFLEISHSAKIGTVVGSIDLGRLVRATEPEAALLPGSIPQAHRGIIFVDEINRLAETSPELADVLLDAMGTKPGRVQIEETGLPPVELPVQVSVWAASNPDEDPGPLEEVRRQLSDRFDLAIYTDRPGDLAVVEQILALAEQPGRRPRAVVEAQAELWRTRLTLRMASLRQVSLPAEMRQQVAGLYSRFELESLRAVQAIQSGVRLMACLDNRTEALPEDLQRIAPMALRHRVDPETVRKVAAFLSGGPDREEILPGAARTRFSGLSFGGVVAEGEAPSHPYGPLTTIAPQHLSSPAPTPPPPGNPARPSWFRRTLAHLGLGRPADGGSSQTGLDRFGRGSGVGAGLSGVGAGGAAGPAGGGRSGPVGERSDPAGGRSGSTGHRRDPLGEAAAGTRAVAGGAASGQAGGRLPDPAAHPPEAPPNPARPLSALDPTEWVRTEEELGRP